MKVLSIPHINQLSNSESGIHTVVRSYFSHLPKYGIEMVSHEDSCDLIAVHAGMGRIPPDVPLVCHLHGLYWTSDYYMPSWAYRSNEHIVNTIRIADAITVPSDWVAQTLRRDMHLDPYVLPHGINCEEWSGGDDQGYIIGYAKNRAGMDVCNPSFLSELAPRFPEKKFYATFSPPSIKNVEVTGILPHAHMKNLVKGASVYISTTKETWGIGMLEAMAAGVPVLAYGYGGALELVTHGVTGYLAQPDNISDLVQGLDYCLKYRRALSVNSRAKAKSFTWDRVARQLSKIYADVLSPKEATVSVIIPSYNKDKYLERAVNSVLSQSIPVESIIIVDDGSTDETGSVGLSLASAHSNVSYIRQDNQGVSHARNNGIKETASSYICCLDADDWIDDRFLEACISALESDKALGIAYTGLTWHRDDGTSGNSNWPGQFNYDQQLKRKNQVPTCCVFRRDAWERTGGYRQRYAPKGAGAEDAEFWTRIGAIGYSAKKVTEAGLFHYQMGGQVSGDPNYREVDWLSWHPWAKDNAHPFCSVATPTKKSHPVRQYDEPIISVVIPVGLGHGKYLVDALDSLEAQTIRNWEAIVVIDWGDENNDALQDLRKQYPFVNWVVLDESTPVGAGRARNVGADKALAPFLLFLDADDWLHPECMEKMIAAWSASESCVYSDYIGIATVDSISNLDRNLQENVIDYDEDTYKAIIRYRASPFDKSRANRQPDDPLYLWCNITTLIPRTWHSEIGGFDEGMKSWEDVDYWYRLAWSGRDFHRVEEPLLVYRFDTGSRRQEGRHQWDYLISYLKEKKKRYV